MTNDEIFDLARNEIKENEKIKKELAKYKRAFEILKDEFKVEIERDFYETHIEYNVVLRHRGDNYGILIDELTREEAELLEELMSDGKI